LATVICQGKSKKKSPNSLSSHIEQGLASDISGKEELAFNQSIKPEFSPK
jgi:hypothetical protein